RSGACAGAWRTGTRPRVGGGAEPFARRLAVRCRAGGPPDVCCRGGRSCTALGRGQRGAGTAGRARRSHRRLAYRVSGVAGGAAIYNCHPPMTRQYCHVGSRTIAYLDSAPGARDLRAVVLLHAFPLGASMWEPQLRRVPKGWRLITPDLRGFGGSTSDNGTPTMDDYAVDVMGLLGELGVGRAVVGGCSMGGYATFALLKRAPDLAIGVVLSDPRMGADSPEGRANRRSMLALVDREGPSGIARDMMP